LKKRLTSDLVLTVIDVGKPFEEFCWCGHH